MLCAFTAECNIQNAGSDMLSFAHLLLVTNFMDIKTKFSFFIPCLVPEDPIKEKERKSSLMARQVKGLELSLLWLRLLPWLRFNPWFRSFCVPWAWPEKKKRNKNSKTYVVYNL